MKVNAKGDELLFSVRAKPKAKRSAVGDASGEALPVAVAAPPSDGEANAELVAVLARALGVPKGAVRIAGGMSSRNKVVAVRGLSEAELLERLAAHARARRDA